MITKKDNKEKYECFYDFMHSQLINETTTIAEALKSFEKLYESHDGITDVITISPNTSVTSNNISNYVTSSTDEIYDKSSIRHFKSLDEECEMNDSVINDY